MKDDSLTFYQVAAYHAHKRQPIRLYGAYWADDCLDRTMFSTLARGKSGIWHIARPAPFNSLFERLRMAWSVLTYRADAIYWEADYDE